MININIKYQIITTKGAKYDQKESFPTEALAQAKIDQSYASYSHSIILMPNTIGIGLKLFSNDKDKSYYGEIVAESELFWDIETINGKVKPFSKKSVEDNFFKKIFIIKDDNNNE